MQFVKSASGVNLCYGGRENEKRLETIQGDNTKCRVVINNKGGSRVTVSVKHLGGIDFTYGPIYLQKIEIKDKVMTLDGWIEEDLDEDSVEEIG